MTPRLVAIVGRAGSGKDTIGRMLEELGGWRTLSFAAPLKQICRDVFDFSDDQLYGPSECRNGGDPRYPRPDGTCLSPREALQKLGTEWGRACYPNVWVDLGVRRARAHMAEGYSVAFTDCRFINEALAIREAGGQVWRVRRLSADRVYAGHESERELDSPTMHCLVTRYIDNEGSLSDLRSLIGNLNAQGVGQVVR